MKPKALLDCCRGWFVGRRGDAAAGRRVEVTKDRWRVFGQSLVEFALIGPVFIMVVMGVVDLGRVFYTYEALANAAREGARYCALHTNDPWATSSIAQGTIDRVTNELASTVTGLSVYGATSSQAACSKGITAGSSVTVSAATTFTPITPVIAGLLPNKSSLTITAQASMMAQ